MTYAGVMISLDVPRGRRIKWLEADRWPFVICRPTECWPQVGKIGARGSAAFFFFFFGRKFACGVWAIDKRPAGGRPAFEPANGEINDN